MKFLKDRTEFAKAVNFGKYPVLRIDLADTDDSGLKGCKVRVDAGTFRTGERHLIDATIRVFRDDKRLTTFAGSCCLHAEFSYYDYVEDVENAMAPIIHPDEDVVVAVYDSRKKMSFAAAIVHTSKRVNRGCVSPIEFEDADFTPYLMMAGIND